MNRPNVPFALDSEQAAARFWFETLRDRICAEFEAIEREAGSDASFDYTGWNRDERHPAGFEQPLETGHDRPVIWRVFQHVEGGDVIERCIRQGYLIARQAQDLVGPKLGPKQPQCLLMVIQDHDPTPRLHLLGKPPGAGATIKQLILRAWRSGPPEPSPGNLPLAGIIPVQSLPLF